MNIGRVFDIEVRIHWSWFVIFTLVTASLAAGAFPAWHPDWSPLLAWTVAISASLLFFYSIFVHELAHCLVARARGLPVQRITLFLFGGVSNLAQDPPSALDEFLITIAGPLTSFLVGGACLFAANWIAGPVLRGATSPAEAIASVGPLATLLVWLGPVNLLVAAFNLIPGFPLDGGRILRATIWAATGDVRRATRWAAGAGRAVALAFIALGVAMVFGVRIPFFGMGAFNGLWLVLIGWFLYDAASASEGEQRLRAVLHDVPVARLMRRNVPGVAPDLAVRDLVDQWLLQTDQRAFPVVAGDHLTGIVTLDDVRKVGREHWEHLRVADIMTPESRLEVVEPQVDADVALGKLLRRNIEQLPVLLDGHLEGIVRRADILRWVELHSGFAR